VGGVIDPAREGVVVERAAALLKPSQDARPRCLEQLEPERVNDFDPAFGLI
jgi:hypothetical protein